MAHVVSHQAQSPLHPSFPVLGTIQRVADHGFRILLRRAHFGKEGIPVTVVPKISQPRAFRNAWLMRSEFFLTLDITPGFILLFMVEVVHIGKTAKLARVSVDTIRFYQKLGLIKSAGRTAGGYRLFDEEQIRDLTFVRHAQELGFSLAGIRELLALRQKHHACSEVQSMLKRKVGDVKEKINSLSRLEAELADALCSCNRKLRLKREIKHEDCCPLLTKLDRPNGSNGNKHVSNRRKSGDK
jgi:DNA-binding transcriptional MerR regulator